MMRSLSRDFRPAARCALRTAGGLVILAGCLARPLPASAAPPSLLAEHQVAQAGLTIGLGLNFVAQFAAILGAVESTGCGVSLGTTSVLSAQNTVGNFTAAASVIYYDLSCRTPYLSDTFEFTGQLQTSGQVKIKSARQLLAPNGAILGALSLLENYDETSNSNGNISGIGTYSAVANAKAPLVHVGFACGVATTTFTCQMGAAQDFPSLNKALGSIAQLKLTVITSGPQAGSLVVTSTGVYLATGALGHLSIDLATPTTLGFAGTHTLTLGGTASGSSPQYSPIFASGTKWSFNDSAQGLSFSLNTASSLTSSGKIVDTPTHATLATLTLDKSGTGAISYSDHSTAPITSWTLGD